MTRHRNPRDKAATQKWARDLMQLDNFYVLDTETTGAGKTDEIIQLGVVDKHGETVFDVLLKPTVQIQPGASAVNGIYAEDVADAPNFAEIHHQVLDVLKGSVLIAYNMDFDWRMLSQTATRYRKPPIRVKKKACAMKEYARFRGDWNSRHRQYRWHKLTNACGFEGIEVRDAHNALGDVLMTLELIKKMAAE